MAEKGQVRGLSDFLSVSGGRTTRHLVTGKPFVGLISNLLEFEEIPDHREKVSDFKRLDLRGFRKRGGVRQIDTSISPNVFFQPQTEVSKKVQNCYIGR